MDSTFGVISLNGFMSVIGALRDATVLNGVLGSPIDSHEEVILEIKVYFETNNQSLCNNSVGKQLEDHDIHRSRWNLGCSKKNIYLFFVHLPIEFITFLVCE